MERIVFLDRRTCRVPIREPGFPHQWQDYDSTTPDQVVDRLQGATIAITNKVPLRNNTLKQLPNLKFIAVAATGVDCIDLEYCRQHKILVSNVPHYTRHSVPEHVFMLILALKRNLIAYHTAVRAGRWQKSADFFFQDFPIHNLHGSTLGIIGYGDLGKEVEKLGMAFGMKILIAERKHALEIRPGRVPFEEVLQKSDVITLHTPLTPATRLLIGAIEFTRMKPHVLLINVARGGLVDERALAEVLRTGMIGGAAVDVLSEEPPKADNPLLERELSNLIITPHIGWASEEALSDMVEQLIRNIEGFVIGSPKNLVN
jgi:glycerate dehydrogenase